MAEKQKNRKQGRQKKSAQNSRYINEKRQEQNKLVKLKRHVAAHGMTTEVRDAIRKCEIILFGAPKTDTPANRPNDRSPASAAFYRRPDAEQRRRDMRVLGVVPKQAA